MTLKFDIEKILHRSTKATCGIMEREITVAKARVPSIKSTLRSKGFMVIGTSEPDGKTRKVWFIRRGGF